MSNITVISTLPTTATEAVVSAAASALTSYLNNSTSHSESLLATALSVVSSHASKKIEFHPNISHKIQYKHHTSIKYDFSPVTLSSNWSRLSRLLILSCLSVIGSVGNVFMISSLLIEEYLKRAGNAFIGNIALADLLITSVLIPASTIILLADIKPNSAVCNMQWFFASCAFLVTIFSLVMSAFENYCRVCTPQDGRAWFNRKRTTAILLLIWFLCTFATSLQYVFEMSFDYCAKQNMKPLPSDAAYYAGIIIVPIVLTLYIHIKIIIDVRKFMTSPNFRPNMIFTRDIELTKTNFYSFIIFVVFWLPFAVVLAYGPVGAVSNQLFYGAAWFGFCKSCFHNVIYCFTNNHFRSAYVRLFNYCCCKTTVAQSRRQRGEGCRPTADVRVHIIPGYNMYSYTSPQRAGNNHNTHHWGKRDMHEL